MSPSRYHNFNTWLRQHFGCRVQKITLDAGLTCPNRDGRIGLGGCIYCNTRGSGTGAHTQRLSIREQIQQAQRVLSKRYKAQLFLAYFQSFTNTYGPVEHLQKLYAEALAADQVVGLAIGTRPDCVAEPVLELLADYARHKMIWLEYGLQSTHDHTLARINRGHNAACFEKTLQRTTGRGIYTCAHLILGLPGETRADMLATARRVARMPLDGIKLHLLYVIKGTVLETWYQHGRYHCLSQAEYVDLVCDFLELLPSHMVIQRLTGDPHPAELVAPAWALRKQENLSLIQQALTARDTWQGRLAGFQRKFYPNPIAPES